MQMPFQHPVTYRELTSVSPLRQVCSVAVAVFIAFMVGYLYSFGNEFWIPLTAFFVSQTTRGTPLRQGMTIFLIMVCAILISFLFILLIKKIVIVYAIVACIFTLVSYLAFIYRPQSKQTYFMTMLFPVTLLFAVFSPVSVVAVLQDRIFDTAIGALIGILCRFVVLPVKLDVAFSEGVVPTLAAMNEFMEALMTKNNLAERRLQVEESLIDMYPSWIYEVGFNRGLRSGFRFFLVNIERVSEVLFSMDYLIARGMDVSHSHELQRHLGIVMQKNQQLLLLLIQYFNQGKIGEHMQDYTADMNELENILRLVIPDNMEGLMLSPALLLITAFVRDMRDLRMLLLDLVKSVA